MILFGGVEPHPTRKYMDFEVVTKSPGETVELGVRFGAQLRGVEVVAIYGTLGTGKTHFVKGVSAGCEVEDSLHVNSPTFALVNEYHGRVDLYHIDAYRLGSVAEFEMLGFDEFLGAGSVVLIEWADKVEAALAGMEVIEVRIEHCGGDCRRVRVRGCPDYISF